MIIERNLKGDIEVSYVLTIDGGKRKVRIIGDCPDGEVWNLEFLSCLKIAVLAE